MPNGSTVSEAIRFGRYTLDPRRALLSVDGRAIALRPKAFDVLHCLLSRAGRVVSKDELAELVWPGVAVSDESLTKCISEVRLALGADGPTIIKTVPRRGYMLDVPVSEEAADSFPAISGLEDAPPTVLPEATAPAAARFARRQRAASLAAAAVCIAALIAILI